MWKRYWDPVGAQADLITTENCDDHRQHKQKYSFQVNEKIRLLKIIPKYFHAKTYLDMNINIV